MISARLSRLGLSQMSKGWRAISWLIVGPLASLFLGYLVFLALLFASGPAANIDTKGTHTQELISVITVPALGSIFVLGTLYSIYKAISYWFEKENETGA